MEPNKMKVFYLILCICFALFITIESSNTVKKHHEIITNRWNDQACRNSSGITIEYLDSITQSPAELDNLPKMAETKHKIGCYLSCLMQQYHIINGTVVDIKKISDLLKMTVDSSEESNESVVPMLISIVENCSRQVENMTDACLIAWKFGLCMGSVLGV